MTDASEWPLPSESRRVRALLYLAEGMITGGALPVVLAIVAGVVVAVYRTVVVNPTVTAAGAVGFPLALHLLLRSTALATAVRHSRREDKPEVRDWTETRQWRWVAVVALVVAALLVAVPTALGWAWHVSYWGVPRVLCLATVGAGFLLRLYVLHRVEVDVL